MNVRNDVIINSPNNKDETCAEFVIDDITKPFVFSGTTEADEDYTFSAWIKSTEDSSISVYGETIPVTTEWKRKRVTFEATGTGVKIYFNKTGTYYFYKSQLELGKVMSDASPSPEDIKASLEVKINRENLISEINASADVIRLTGDRLIIDSTNLQVTEDGTLTAKNGKFTGIIEATEGKIAGFDIGEYGLIYGDTDTGVYTQLSGDGIRWIAGIEEEHLNEYNGNIEFYRENRWFQFYSAYKGYEDDVFDIKPIGGIDSFGIFKGESYLDWVNNPAEHIITWDGNANFNTVKTKGNIFLPNGIALRGMKSNSTVDSDIIAYVSTGNRVVLGNSSNSNPTDIRSPQGLYLKCNGMAGDDNNECGVLFFYTNSAAWFRPCADGVTNLGGTNYHWKNVYATNGTIQTSDRNKKKNIQNIDEKYIKLFDLLVPKTFEMKNGDRTHVGFIAQDVEEAMEKVGLSNEDFAGLCIDYDEDGNKTYSLRYGELFMLCIAKLKELERMILNEY